MCMCMLLCMPMFMAIIVLIEILRARRQYEQQT